MGGWTLRSVGLSKSSFITKDDHEACQADHVQQKQQKNTLHDQLNPTEYFKSL
jgi:hypothetical protein